MTSTIWRRPIAVVGAFALAATGLALGAAVAPAQAAPGDGTLTVVVDRDFSGDGLYNAGVDQPQAGIDVTVSDAAGTAVSGVTDATGHFVVPSSAPLTGGRYLVEAGIPAALGYLQAAPASAAGGPNSYRSLTSFVDVSSGTAQTIRLGVWNPADYAQLDPDYVLAIEPAPDTPANGRTLVRTAWGNRGDGNGAQDVSNTQGMTTIATLDQTGSIYGTAWSRTAGRVFSAAFAKAFVPYGIAGPGGIYVTNPDAGVPNAALYATIPNAGTTDHTPNANAVGKDDPFFAAPGAESLGGIALSDDDRTLYVVNLHDKHLYGVDVSDAATGGAVTDLGEITDPGCVGGQWRPGAVTVRDGVVYVGGVCDASTSMDRSDLRAYVLRLSSGGYSTVLSQPLDFLRGNALYSSGDISRHWNPWISTWSRTTVENWTPDDPQSLVNVLYPSPLLTSLEFDTDGSIFLGFRDRFGDQVGRNGLEPGPGTTNLVGTVTAGDLNKACRNPDGSYSWEGTGGCPSNAQSFPSGDQDPAVDEYFEGDWTTIDGVLGGHQEITQGGIAFAAREGDVLSNSMDTTGLLNSGGVGFFDTTTGEGPGGNPTSNALLVTGGAESFGKGNGLGDLELIVDSAPVQIGNRVWYDTNKDGVQDANEPSLPGASVSLLDSTGTVVATTTTNADGEYYFGGDDAAYQLERGADYTVRFDVSTVDKAAVPGIIPTDPFTFTAVGAGGDASRDSNPTATGAEVAEAPVTAPSVPGGVDHTIDAGVVGTPAPVSIGDYVWIDEDGDGVQDASETPAPGVTVRLLDAGGTQIASATTDANGYYAFAGLTPGTGVIVEFPTTITVGGVDYRLTGHDQGTDDALDSDADESTGRVAVTTPLTGSNSTVPGLTDNPTIDAGYLPPPVSPPSTGGTGGGPGADGAAVSAPAGLASTGVTGIPFLALVALFALVAGGVLTVRRRRAD